MENEIKRLEIRIKDNERDVAEYFAKNGRLRDLLRKEVKELNNKIKDFESTIPKERSPVSSKEIRHLKERVGNLEMNLKMEIARNGVIVIDGSNVAHGGSKNLKKPSVHNIKAAIFEVEKYGFKPVLVVSSKLRHELAESELPELDKLLSKYGTGAPTFSDDDSLILEQAERFDALILSHDLYENYWKLYPKAIIRRVDVTITNGKCFTQPRLSQLKPD